MPLASLSDPAVAYRVVATLLLAGVGAAAAVRGRLGTGLAVGLAAAVAAVLGVATGRDDAILPLAALAAGPALAAAGLAAVGRRLGAPAVAASAVAALTVWVGCGGVWWADRLAARVPAADRTRVREAVLGADPVTAAAYAVGHDRLHAADVYDEVVIASTTVRAPDAATTAVAWGAVGAGLLVAAAARRPTRRGTDPRPGTAGPGPGPVAGTAT